MTNPLVKGRVVLVLLAVGMGVRGVGFCSANYLRENTVLEFIIEPHHGPVLSTKYVTIENACPDKSLFPALGLHINAPSLIGGSDTWKKNSILNADWWVFNPIGFGGSIFRGNNRGHNQCSNSKCRSFPCIDETVLDPEPLTIFGWTGPYPFPSDGIFGFDLDFSESQPRPMIQAGLVPNFFEAGLGQINLLPSGSSVEDRNEEDCNRYANKHNRSNGHYPLRTFVEFLVSTAIMAFGGFYFFLRAVALANPIPDWKMCFLGVMVGAIGSAGLHHVIGDSLML